MQPTPIIPAIIPDTFERLDTELAAILHTAMRVQIDVMNGTYAPPTTWPYGALDRDVFAAIQSGEQGMPYWEDVDFEIDLMVDRPENHMEEWIVAGASTLIVHIETTERLDAIFSFCSERSVEVALALKPSTSIELLAPYVDRAAFVQCMGSDKIGYHSVALDPTVADKVASIAVRWPSARIGVDIGVSDKTLPALVMAGATRFAVGSAIFDAPVPKKQITQLETLVTSLLDDRTHR